MRLDDGRVVPNFIGQALRGEPLTVYGDGSQTRSFCYVADLVDGIYRLLESSDFHEPVNIGNPDEMTDPRSSRRRSSRCPAARARSCSSRCRRTTRRCASRTSRGAASCSAGSRGGALGRVGEDDRVVSGETGEPD